MQHGLFELSACEERVYDKIQDIELKSFIDRVDLYQKLFKKSLIINLRIKN